MLDPTSVSGRDLTTADFFDYPQGWRDGRFDVAGQKGLQGVAGTLSDCDDEPDDDSPVIEMRLANKFTKLSMKVGQSDSSPTSDVVVAVKVIGNGTFIDTVRVPFNRISPLPPISVKNVNALKIQVWLTGEKCTYSSEVEAVLMELRLE